MTITAIDKIEASCVQFEQAINDIRRIDTDAKARLSVVEQQINDFYHMLEYLSLSAVEMIQLTKQLKVALQARRDLKEEIIITMNLLREATKISKAAMDQERKKSESRLLTYERESKLAYHKLFGKMYTRGASAPITRSADPLSPAVVSTP